eukprot:4146888-Amphidinium_carterae.1
MPSVDLGSGRIAVQVSSGFLSEHTCVLLDDSSITCWGNAIYGQLGMQDTVNRGGSPGTMGNNLPLVDLGSGFTPATLNRMNYDRSCAISSDGSWKCWGLAWLSQNAASQLLGYEDEDNRGDAEGEMGGNLPVVNLGSGLLADTVQHGVWHMCALFTTHSVKCFGVGSIQALGYGDTTDRLTNLANNL